MRAESQAGVVPPLLLLLFLKMKHNFCIGHEDGFAAISHHINNLENTCPITDALSIPYEHSCSPN